MDTMQERRKFNEEIEKVFMEVSIYAVDILMYRQTESGISDIDLYKHFYNAFTYLVMLTSDLPQLRDNPELAKPIIAKALAYIDTKVNIDNMKDVIRRCEAGVVIFMDYKKLLMDQGVIALPAK